MCVFALGGTSYGMWEETLGFFVLLVPLALALGYDRMAAAAIIFLGAGSGVIASTVNPFSTGVASDAAGIRIGDGIGLRIAMWFVLVSLAIAFVIWYARRVQHTRSSRSSGSRPQTPPTPRARQRRTGAHRPPEARARPLRRDVPGDDLRVHPWNDLWQEGFGKDFPLPTFSDFYFPEAATLFLLMAVVIGLIARLGEEGTVTTIVAGAADFLGAGADHRRSPAASRS